MSAEVGVASPESKPQPEAAPGVPAWQPLLDAVAGEWAEYTTLEDRQLRYEVVRAAPSGVVTRVSVREAGRSLGEPAVREDDPDWDPLRSQAETRGAVRRCVAESIDAAGRGWAATLYEDRWVDEEVRCLRKTWVSPQVPFTGVIRMELYGDDRLESRLVLADCALAPAR